MCLAYSNSHVLMHANQILRSTQAWQSNQMHKSITIVAHYPIEFFEYLN